MLHMPTFPDILVVISWRKQQQNVTCNSLRERESSTNKSPGGLNAHLNWRKLPLVHRGMLSIRKAMEALPLVTFYIGPPPQPATPPPGPLGPPWKLPRTIFILHLRRSIRTTCITLLFYFNWIWRRSLKFAKFWPLGPSPWAPMVATCTIWTPLNPQPLRMIPAKFG